MYLVRDENKKIHIEFRHSDPLELTYIEADTNGYTYMAKKMEPSLPLSIMARPHYMTMVIDSPGMVFKSPRNFNGKDTIKKLAKEEIGEAIKNCKLQPNEFSVIMDRRGYFYVFGNRHLTTKLMALGEDGTSTRSSSSLPSSNTYWYRDEESFTFAHEDLVTNEKVIEFPEHATENTQLLRQDRGFGFFITKYKLSEKMMYYSYNGFIWKTFFWRNCLDIYG